MKFKCSIKSSNGKFFENEYDTATVAEAQKLHKHAFEVKYPQQAIRFFGIVTGDKFLSEVIGD